jgi:hypothetical protein
MNTRKMPELPADITKEEFLANCFPDRNTWENNFRYGYPPCFIQHMTWELEATIKDIRAKRALKEKKA